MPQKKSKWVKVTPYSELRLCLFSTNYHRFCNVFLEVFYKYSLPLTLGWALNCQAGRILWTWPSTMRDGSPQPWPNYGSFKAAMWIKKALGVVKAWHLPSTEKKWKVASTCNSTSQLQSPGCTAHLFLPTSHGQKTTQMLPSASQHPNCCFLPPSQYLLWVAEGTHGQPGRSSTILP